MRRLLLILLVLAPLAGLTASGAPTPAPEVPARLAKLAAHLPPPNQFVAMKDLGITACEPSPSPDTYNFCPPKDLDVHRLDADGMHLNMPLHVVPGAVNYLFMSDQPEEARDDRKREDGSTGATGVYTDEDLPGQAPIRVLMDHTNGTKRPLHLWLVWLPEADGVLMIRKTGGAAGKDSVAAGARSFQDASDVPVIPRQALEKGHGVAVFSAPLAAGDTAVVEGEFTSTVPGRLVSLLTEAEAAAPLTAEAIAAYPLMHSIIWREEESRLKKFVNPETQPTRFAHIMEQAQHSRGRFHFPDRMAYAVYDAPTWDESKSPLVQIYTIYESVPGQDEGTPTENRGKYGAVVGLRWKIKRLPPGCTQVAIVALNPGAVFGGRTDVTDEVRLGVESLWLPDTQPGLFRTGQAATLWRGAIHPGETITLWTEPMGNISVALWYAVVPLP